MSLDTFTYTQPEYLTPEAVKAQSRFGWTPPKGHANYCAMQLPPWWRTGRCDCPQNTLAKHLRKLATLQEPSA